MQRGLRGSVLLRPFVENTDVRRQFAGESRDSLEWRIKQRDASAGMSLAIYRAARRDSPERKHNSSAFGREQRKNSKTERIISASRNSSADI